MASDLYLVFTSVSADSMLNIPNDRNCASNNARKRPVFAPGRRRARCLLVNFVENTKKKGGMHQQIRFRRFLLRHRDGNAADGKVDNLFLMKFNAASNFLVFLSRVPKNKGGAGLSPGTRGASEEPPTKWWLCHDTSCFLRRGRIICSRGGAGPTPCFRGKHMHFLAVEIIAGTGEGADKVGGILF